MRKNRKEKKVNGKKFPFSEGEVRGFLRDRVLIESIGYIISLASGDQEVFESRSMEMACCWLESLSIEQIWLLLFVMRSFARSRKLKYGTVMDALTIDKLSVLVSLDVPIRGDSDLTLLDKISSSADTYDYVHAGCDQSILRNGIRECMKSDSFSDDERRFVKCMLDGDFRLSDMVERGFTVKKKNNKGEVVERTLPREKIRLLYAGIQRKLRCCSELHDLWEQL